MRIISCAGYYGTGSSAIVDYFSEFSDCFSFADYEFRFLHDPDCVSDLEYNLVENHNRNNSGYALKRYRKMVDFFAGSKLISRYEPFFDNQWKKISYEYIDSLTDFDYSGYWIYDVLDKGKWYYVGARIINKILQNTVWRNNRKKKIENNLNELPNERTLCSRPSEEKFLTLTREYVNKLIAVANKDNKPFVVVDQIVPASNLNRYTRYVDDIVVFVVDRDPRDVYYLAKYVWKVKMVPTESPETFSRWFRYTHAHRLVEEPDPTKVLYVQFEDMVLNYDTTMEKIRNFAGLSEQNHIAKYSFFDPSVSCKNIRPWLKDKRHQAEMDRIKDLLPEFLYDFKE